MASRRPRHASFPCAATAAAWAACLAFTSLPALADGPTWYAKKKQEEKQQEEEQEAKDAEKPIVGGDSPRDAPGFSQLSANTNPPPSTDLLFKKQGLTDSIGMDYGNLNQPDINGNSLSIQYAMGWWWKPNLVLSGMARGTTILQDTFLYMLITAGPQIRYFPTRHWALTAFVGYGFSQGLSRVSINHIPPPPTDTMLGARRGILYSGQAAYLFWPKRDFGIGPSLSYWAGNQDERSLSSVCFGITLQSGRPNYTGDVTDR